MAQPCCPRCKQSISTNDTGAFIVQLDAEAPVELTREPSLRGLVTSASGNRKSPLTSV